MDYQERMMGYYERRAAEYDDAYLVGHSPWA